MKIVVAGDFCPYSRRSKQYLANNKFDKIVGNVKPIIEGSDFSIVNFESPIIHPDVKEPVFPEYVQLGCTVDALKCVKYAGFSMIALANNHLHDYGDKSVEYTISSATEEGVPFTGAGLNFTKAHEPSYVIIDSKKLAVINICENEFSVATDQTPGAAGMDMITNFQTIIYARNNADIVLVFVHGGVEHYQYPTPRMKRLYRFFIDLGADIVVNSHQHCFSGYEKYNGKTIVYGLGNLYFDKDEVKDNNWNLGYMCEIALDGNNQKVSLIPYSQGNSSIGISLLRDTVEFERNIAAINDVISDDTALEKKYHEYLSSSLRNNLSAFIPSKMIGLSKIYRRGFIRFPFSRKASVRLLNILHCESHRDKYIRSLCMLLGLPTYK